MRKFRILDTVVCHLTEFVRIALTKPSKHLLHGHINLLILEKLLRDVVQRVTLELVFTFDVLKHIKHVAPNHRNHLQIVRPERVGRQVFHDEFIRNTTQTTPHVCIRSCASHDCTRVQVLQVEPEDVPARHNVRIEFTEVSTQPLKHLTLRLKRLTLCSVRLLDAKAFPVEVPLMGSPHGTSHLRCEGTNPKRFRGHSHLETCVIRLERVWKRT